MIDYKDKRSGVYKLTNTINGKIYIGSSQNVGERWYKHFEYPHLNKCRLLARAILKYGKDAFVAEIIEAVEPELLIEREQHYLDTLFPFKGIGYNIRVLAGSNRGIVHSEEQKLKWSHSKRGSRNPMWGRSQTQKQKDAVRTAQANKTITDLTRAKLGQHRVKSVQCFTVEGAHVADYKSCAAAVRAVNGDSTALWRCLNNHPNFKTHKGFVWRYKDIILHQPL